LQGIDLVVGAKGSPIQLMLSSVFHLDIPNGNIPLAEANKLKANPLVKSTIPLALGDNYQGFRIVGTTVDYITHYSGSFAEGGVFKKPMEVVVGSNVAGKNQLHLNDAIIGTHGLTNSDDLHSALPYKVVGILQPTGTVLDRLVLTPIESVWQVHEHHEDDADAKPHGEKEITALLISYKSPLAAVTIPRMVNKSTALQAASPAFEMARLIKIMGVGGDAISWFAGLLILLASAGFFVTLFNAVNERRYDLMLMRSLGASRRKIFTLVISEGVTLGLAGVVSGLVLGHSFAYGAKTWLEQSRGVSLESVIFHPYEIYVVIVALLVSVLASVIPAMMAYRLSMANVLARGS